MPFHQNTASDSVFWFGPRLNQERVNRMPIFWGEHCVWFCVHPFAAVSRLQNGVHRAIEVHVDKTDLVMPKQP